MNLDSIQLFPETQLNFAPVQLFPDIQPDFLHQAPLCDPDQFLVPGYSLAPLPTFPDSVEQTPSVLLPINQDSVQQTPSVSLPINQDSVEQTPHALLPINQDSVEQIPSASLPINQDCVEQTPSQCVQRKSFSQQLMKTPTIKKTASTRFAPIISDKEVRAMRERAIPKNTKKCMAWLYS